MLHPIPHWFLDVYVVWICWCMNNADPRHLLFYFTIYFSRSIQIKQNSQTENSFNYIFLFFHNQACQTVVWAGAPKPLYISRHSPWVPPCLYSKFENSLFRLGSSETLEFLSFSLLLVTEQLWSPCVLALCPQILPRQWLWLLDTRRRKSGFLQSEARLKLGYSGILWRL